jgi:hypothetical protein
MLHPSLRPVLSKKVYRNIVNYWTINRRQFSVLIIKRRLPRFRSLHKHNVGFGFVGWQSEDEDSSWGWRQPSEDEDSSWGWRQQLRMKTAAEDEDSRLRMKTADWGWRQQLRMKTAASSETFLKTCKAARCQNSEDKTHIITALDFSYPIYSYTRHFKT